MPKFDILKKFGLNVKFARMKQGITQAELAEILEVHEKYISRIETGKQNVTLKSIEKLAEALKTDIAFFFKK